MPTYRELLNDSATPVMVRRIIALLTDEKGHSRYDPVDVLNNLEVLVLAAKADCRHFDELILSLRQFRETSNDRLKT